MDNNILQDTNNKIVAINKILDAMTDMLFQLGDSKEITEEVQKIIIEIMKSEMGFLSKKFKKECRAIAKEADSMITKTKNFDRMFVDSRSRIWGNRSDGR